MPETTVVKALPPLPEGEVAAIRRRRHLCHLAAKVAVALPGLQSAEGVGLGVLKKTTPVLDAGCRNPYLGLWFALRRDFNWQGAYYGVDASIPRAAVEEWERKRRVVANHARDFKMWARPLELGPDDYLTWGGRRVVPPTLGDPYKPFGVAFAVDLLGRIRERERLVAELRRTSASVVVVGGATVAEVDRWDFQTAGLFTLASGEEVAWGVWLDLRAEAYRRRISVVPRTTAGWFAHKHPRGQGGQGMFGAILGVCQRCGRPDASGRSRFGCAHCGADNSVAGPIVVTTAN